MEKSLQYSGQPVFYTITGSGDPVVLLHGLAEDSTLWQLQVDHLSGSYTLIIPDLPGSGGSLLPAQTTMESLAGAVKAILEAEKVPEAVVIGHSMGGYVALAFAELYPGMLKAMGLFHSTAYADGEERKAARNKNIDFINRQGTHAFLKQVTPNLFSNDSKTEQPQLVKELIDRYSDFNPASLVAYNQAMLQRPDRSRLLAEADYPILFMIGKQDNTIPFHQSLELAHLPAIAYIYVLEKSGHMGMIEEADKSNQLLKKFLEDIYGEFY